MKTKLYSEEELENRNMEHWYARRRHLLQTIQLDPGNWEAIRELTAVNRRLYAEENGKFNDSDKNNG